MHKVKGDCICSIILSSIQIWLMLIVPSMFLKSLDCISLACDEPGVYLIPYNIPRIWYNGLLSHAWRFFWQRGVGGAGGGGGGGGGGSEERR